MWPIYMIRSCEALLVRAIPSGDVSGVDSNRDVTLDNRGATEIAWQN